ncbi:MAG: hypothetical protein CML47_01215 [Rhodobacteraceae bacterium]|nr:MAG: hypothetical protein CML47_01215 [Paracoccaceae bacterium]|tara:strand:- start:6382 stop:7266 length:885 start_codon:yes stop_codon:yes gene_type:complete
MIYSLSDFQEIDNLKPIISGSIPGNNYHSLYHKVSYKAAEQTILFQSPLCNIVSFKKDWICFQFNTEEKINSNFAKSFQKLLKRITRKTESKYIKKIVWDLPNSGPVISLSGIIIKGCLLYDDTKNLLELNEDIKNNVSDFIFTISCVRLISPFDDETRLYGKIMFEILQIRTRPQKVVAPQCFAFKSQPQSKYLDMIKKGVPRPAVEQKMKCDGVDIGILDGSAASAVVPVATRICAQELKNAKLRRVRERAEPRAMPKQKGISLGISYEDIHRALKNLRRTNLLTFSSNSSS